MEYSDEEFLAKIKPMVIADMQKSGILASLTAAQAFIESKKGNSGLTKKANNLFGMKGTYNGESVKMNTKEFKNGRYVTIVGTFRKYPSWVESIADHSGLFNRLPRYSNLRGCKDYKKACKYVKDDGYATDPDYTETLLDCIETYNLYTWDAEIGIGNPYREPITNVKKGEKGDIVKWIQWQLNQYGYGLEIDGDFGNDTLRCVRGFQKAKKLEIDGIVGKDTRKALLDE